jgi:hypothetical protein
VESRQEKSSCVSGDMNDVRRRYTRVKWYPRKLTGRKCDGPGNGRGVCFWKGNEGGAIRICTWSDARDRSTTNEQEQELGNVDDERLQGGER